jgi:hypothetical protein
LPQILMQSIFRLATELQPFQGGRLTQQIYM